MRPLVSVVIPTYGGERYLSEAIDSCLSQTYPRVEVIVVDDASPDGCADIAEKHARADGRVRLIRRPHNGGVSRALNDGYRSASGQYLTRLAQDDYYAADAFSRMVDCLELRPDVGLVYGDMVEVGDDGRILGRVETPGPESALQNGDRLGLCVMWRRSVWEAVGDFDPRYDTAEDYDYWMRVSKRFGIAKCPDSAVLYMRLHSEMGSVRYRHRQELAAARIEARECADKALARRILGDAHYDVAFAFRAQGQWRRSLYHLLCAAACRPLDGRPYRSLLGMVRRPMRRASQ